MDGDVCLGDWERAARTAAAKDRQCNVAAERLQALQRVTSSTPNADLTAARQQKALVEAELRDVRERLESVEGFKGSVLHTIRALKAQIAEIALQAAAERDSDASSDASATSDSDLVDDE
jgi:hypothetical protein